MPRPGIAIFTHGRFTGTQTPVSKGLSIFTWGKFGKLPLVDVLDGDVVEFGQTIKQLEQPPLAISQSAQATLALSLARQSSLSMTQVFAQTLTIARVESKEFVADGFKATEFER